MAARQLILASASPRRAELLRQLGVRFSVEPAHIDESVTPGEPPADYVQRMAREKSAAVAHGRSAADRVVLGADTTVVLGDEALGKPADRAEGLAMLQRLSGRVHRVYTAVALAGPGVADACLVCTEVEFLALEKSVCEAYLDSGEPWDKAGGYAIQGLGGALVRRIAGSYSNVVGLPLAETWELLSDCGVATGLTPARDTAGSLRSGR